jgi:DNA-binding NarL/FixJ family response regulator
VSPERGLFVVVDPTGQLADRLRELLLLIASDLPAQEITGVDALESALPAGPVDVVAIGSADRLRDAADRGAPALLPVRRRREQLTRREAEVLSAAGRGRSNAAIARDLYVSQDTVRFHLRNAYRKLGVHDRVRACVLAAAAEPPL